MAVTDTPALTPEQIVERTLKVVDEHVHNENPVDIDTAIAVGGDTVVNEVGPSGILTAPGDFVDGGDEIGRSSHATRGQRRRIRTSSNTTLPPTGRHPVEDRRSGATVASSTRARPCDN
jgi:hypothetical protein